MKRPRRRVKKRVKRKVAAKRVPLPRPVSTLPPFDFTTAIELLCRDMVRALPEMAHIQCDRIAFCFSQARNRQSHGIFASLTPLRAAGGGTMMTRRGRPYVIQKVISPQGVEMLYILTCYLPRFMDLSFREKLITIYHELWHIGPCFDGDMRRHEGRCFAHTHSQKEYDAQMALFVDRYLKQSPPESLLAFLRNTFDQLSSLHGTIVGQKIPRPKLIPVPPTEVPK